MKIENFIVGQLYHCPTFNTIFRYLKPRIEGGIIYSEAYTSGRLCGEDYITNDEYIDTATPCTAKEANEILRRLCNISFFKEDEEICYEIY